MSLYIFFYSLSIYISQCASPIVSRLALSFFGVFVHVSIFVQVCPIQDDEDGHLSYKLGDIIENDQQRCKYRTLLYEPILSVYLNIRSCYLGDIIENLLINYVFFT